MNRFSILLTASLITCPIILMWQTRDENWVKCNNNQPDVSIEACTVLIETGQEPSENLTKIFKSRGNAYSRKRDFDHAIQDYSESLRLDSKDSGTLLNRALAYSGKGDLDRAVQDYNQMLLLNPRDIRAVGNRAVAYSAKKDYSKAILDYSQAIELDPEHVLYYYNRGNMFRNIGEYGRAIEDYDQASRIDPNFQGIEINRGMTNVLRSEFDLAIKDFTNAEYHNPKADIAIYDRGRVEFYLGKIPEAELDLAKAHEMQPRNRRYAIWLYLVQSRSRSATTALSTLDAASAQFDVKTWPGQVVQFYLNKISSEEMLAGAKDVKTEIDRDQHCEAYYFLAEQALLKGNQTEAVEWFRKSIAEGKPEYNVFIASKVELKRMKLEP